MYKCIAVILATGLCALISAVHADTFSSLEERMSQSEFHAAGLDKLTPDELKALDAWLRANYATQTKYVTESGAPLFYPKDSEREKFDAHIVGPFEGWYGHTVFKLDNGQEWAQAESGSSACGRINNPKVTIKPMLMGSWLMYIQGCSDSVRVDRVK